jgi:hypothetical protein
MNRAANSANVGYGLREERRLLVAAIEQALAEFMFELLCGAPVIDW